MGPVTRPQPVPHLLAALPAASQRLLRTANRGPGTTGAPQRDVVPRVVCCALLCAVPCRYDVVFCLLALLSQYLLYSRGTMIMAHFPVPRHEPWWRQVHHLTAFSRIFPEVLATLAVAQLCAITFWPEPYSRWRNAWMVVGRTVRFGAILSIVTYQQHPGIVFNMKRDMEMMTEGGLRGVLAMLRMMIVNSGAMHMGGLPGALAMGCGGRAYKRASLGEDRGNDLVRGRQEDRRDAVGVRSVTRVAIQCREDGEPSN